MDEERLKDIEEANRLLCKEGRPQGIREELCAAVLAACKESG